MSADSLHPLVLVPTLSFRLNGWVFLIFFLLIFFIQRSPGIQAHLMQWFNEYFKGHYQTWQPSREVPGCCFQETLFSKPILVFLCPSSCPLQMSAQLTEPMNQPPPNQLTNTRLTFWSPQFPVSAHHTTASAFLWWRGRRGKGENVPIFAKAAYSLHTNTASNSILLAYLAKLFCYPWKQTVQGSHFTHSWKRQAESKTIFLKGGSEVLCISEHYYTIGRHLLPLSPSNHTTSVTDPWSYAVSFLSQRSLHVNSQAYNVVIHSYCMTSQCTSFLSFQHSSSPSSCTTFQSSFVTPIHQVCSWQLDFTV